MLDETAIKSARRLFMTATPRYFTGRIIKVAKEAEFEVASMDDKAKFGPVFYRLSFAEAIRRKELTDSQVVVVGVDDASYHQWAQKGTIVTRDGKTRTDARSLAGAIGLAKAMKKYDLRRLISFHSRVKRAREFATELPEVIDWMPARQRPKGRLWARPATGEMSAGERHILLQHLAHLDDGQRGLLTNARCLAEGVDVPALDGVAFIDPRRSEVDIVQAVGRAIRKSEDKIVGTIVIPVFLDTDTDPEKALDDSVFRPVWDVVKALRAHDEDLAEQLDSLRRSMGRRRAVPKLPSKIHFDLPVRVGEDFVRAFDTRLVEQTTSSWEFWFGLLEKYVAENGAALVAQSERFENQRLGAWITVQRQSQSKRRLSEERKRRLEALPAWSWDPRDDRWEEGFRHLRQYVDVNGHARVSRDDEVDGYKLGQWVGVQLQAYRQGIMPSDRQARLEMVHPTWTWTVLDDQWEEGFEFLRRYVSQYGHTRVTKPEAFDGYPLGGWVMRQRQACQQGKMASERQMRLESLHPTWSWTPNTDQWDDGFDNLHRYVEQNGTARVRRHEKFEGQSIGQWVSLQRQDYRKDELSPERQSRLENLHPTWSWDPYADDWEEGFAYLRRYISQHGHARVRQPDDFEGYRLGAWVNRQRQAYRKGGLDKLQEQRLAAVHHTWTWNPRDSKWETGFDCLRRYVEQKGDAHVSESATFDGYPLGKWVRGQRHRYRRGLLSPGRQCLLEHIHPTWSWYPHANQWNERFSDLQEYVNQHGDAQVIATTVFNGHRLGGWVQSQRQNYRQGKLSQDRTRKLESLPAWSWRSR